MCISSSELEVATVDFEPIEEEHSFEQDFVDEEQPRWIQSSERNILTGFKRSKCTSHQLLDRQKPRKSASSLEPYTSCLPGLIPKKIKKVVSRAGLNSPLPKGHLELGSRYLGACLFIPLCRANLY